MHLCAHAYTLTPIYARTQNEHTRTHTHTHTHRHTHTHTHIHTYTHTHIHTHTHIATACGLTNLSTLVDRCTSIRGKVTSARK